MYGQETWRSGSLQRLTVRIHHGFLVFQTIVEDVLLDLVYDIAEETFDEVERESGKKELPPDQLEVVMEALTTGPMERVLIQKYAVDITRRHLQCLHPLQWLNDEVCRLVVVAPRVDSSHSTYLHARSRRSSTFGSSCSATATSSS